ncbi:hypothetical protein [Salaquimonas pukyongi]|uniref:hypothetical protein n=1 Tax=Salaquimonas pukyongi TaxID=2712698 RepID=UPI00096B8A28|nr:hypothetical protein [Salaquimonas pukyongi]
MNLQFHRHSAHARAHTGAHTVQNGVKMDFPAKPKTRSRTAGNSCSLEQALADALLEDGKEEFECMLLFEFPAGMLGSDKERAAACLCKLGCEARLVFICASPDGHSVRLYEEKEVTCELVELSWSYARILSFMPGMLTRQRNAAIN